MQIVRHHLHLLWIFRANFHRVLHRAIICHGENLELTRFVRQNRRARHDERVFFGALDFPAHVLVEQQLCSSRQRNVNIDKPRRRIDSPCHQSNCAFHIVCRRIVQRHNRDRRAFLRRGKVFGFDAEFHFNLVLGDDLDQRTARRNDLSILRVHFGNHARQIGMNPVIAASTGALQCGKLSFGVARRFFCSAQILIGGELQIKTILRLLELLSRGLGRILRLLKLNLRARAQLNLG